IARLPRYDERLAVAAEAVEEDGACPARKLEADALAAGGGVLDRRREQAGGLGYSPLVGREQHSPVRGDADAGRGGDRISLRDQLREAVQQQVGGKRLVRRRRRGADRPRDLAERPGAVKLARSRGGTPRLEIRLAREVDVERLELPRRLQQLRGANPEARGR